MTCHVNINYTQYMTCHVMRRGRQMMTQDESIHRNMKVGTNKIFRKAVVKGSFRLAQLRKN